MTTNMTTSNPDTLWATHGSEECEEADEPPELPLKHQSDQTEFQRTAIRRLNENSSLLTKAIMGYSDDDYQPHPHAHEVSGPILSHTQRRRSLASNISLASTADLTSDTGLTSPSRPNTPSPPLPEMTMLRLDGNTPTDPKHVSLLGAAVRLQAQPHPATQAPRKRSIQFACGGKPLVPEANLRAPAMAKTPSAQEAPRRSCIKFACPARPASTQNTPPRDSHMGQASRNVRPESPSTPKPSVLATALQTTPRRPSTVRPKFLRADSKDLVTDGSQFHEFASEKAREDDWIRQENPLMKKKLTINDTLTKEMQIRRLATEAEEEAEAEEEEDELNDEDDDEDAIDDDDDLDDIDAELDDDEDEDEEDDDSDGYHTDEETGFAESDDDDDEDDNMALWTPSQKSVVHISASNLPARRLSLHEQSDSSIATQNSPLNRRIRTKRIKRREETPDLPDSTDFVCGTLDEDRPLEEAYMSCLAARRNEKLRVIPQDIDPSFPASEPEDENDGEIFNPVHHESDDEDEWLHGKMDDIHHEVDRPRRRRKSNVSPKRYRSPPPKRHHSPPPPKNRGRSPKPLFDRPSPRKGRSPAPIRKVTTPLGSPRCGQVKFNLAGRPGLTHTKSLPRAGAIFFIKNGRHQKALNQDHDVHIRGAIDIVKGLESKRQRRKEKFFQKYCNRARRGQLPGRRAMPGRGAERMKELGLLMAGKKDQGNYVLSV